MPYQAVQGLAAIQRAELVQESAEAGLVGRAASVVELLRVSRAMLAAQLQTRKQA